MDISTLQTYKRFQTPEWRGKRWIQHLKKIARIQPDECYVICFHDSVLTTDWEFSNSAEATPFVASSYKQANWRRKWLGRKSILAAIIKAKDARWLPNKILIELFNYPQEAR